MSTGKAELSVSALVLAAGRSTRMGGRNKLLLPIRGKTLVERVVDTVSASMAGEVVVVLGHEAAIVRGHLAGRGVVFAENTSYRRGMTSSIQTGVRAARKGTDAFMICLSDQPLLTEAEMDRLILAFEHESRSGNAPIVVPSHRGQRGNPVIFSAGYRETILMHPEPDGCRGILETHRQHVTVVAMETDHVLRDIDVEGDYLDLIATKPVKS